MAALLSRKPTRPSDRLVAGCSGFLARRALAGSVPEMAGRRKIVWGAVIAALVLAGFSLVGEGGLRRYWKLQREVRTYEVSIAQLIEQNARLRREVQGLKEDPLAIERAVREELGFVRPQEVIITLEGSP
jgi:cell division protein FtsB